MSDFDTLTADEKNTNIAERTAKLAGQGVQFSDPLNLHTNYIRAMLVYIIKNTDGLEMTEAENDYFSMMDTVLSQAEAASARARILGGPMVQGENGHQS